MLATSASLSLFHAASTMRFAQINPIPPVSLPESEPRLEDSKVPRNLPEKLLGDVLVAGTVTALAAPFLTVIDKALVQRSSGSHSSMLASATESVAAMCRNPVSFLRSPTFLWMWATYAATYTAANTLRTATEHHEHYSSSNHQHNSNAFTETTSRPSAATTLFVGTTVVNSTASLIKDRAYAQMFGSGNHVSATVPRISYGLWMARDVTVIGSSFVLPHHVAGFLEQTTAMSDSDAVKVAQLGTPVAAQLIAGPLHFLGLDCYNRSLNHLALSKRILERSRALSASFVEVVAARMARIIPGYGIAGVLNTELRSQWRDQLLHRQHHVNAAAGKNTGNIRLYSLLAND